MVVEERIENLYDQAMQKANNNNDRQAYIKPSDFGFERTSDGTRNCMEVLRNDSRFKRVEMIGKDLLDITLY